MNTEQETNQTETVAQGSGTVLNAAPQAKLEAKLEKTMGYMAGTEDLSPALSVQLGELMGAQSTSNLTKEMLGSVLDYMRETGDKAVIDAKEGARKHQMLYRVVQNYLNNGPEDFRRGFGMLLRIMSDQKKDGVFGPRSLFRYVEHMTLSSKDRRGLELLFQAMVDLSTASGRSTALTQIDLNRVGSQALSADGAQRLNSFFAV